MERAEKDGSSLLFQQNWHSLKLPTGTRERLFAPESLPEVTNLHWFVVLGNPSAEALVKETGKRTLHVTKID